ncbi:MAG: Gfo/Idh/MocA family oxidoreductase [Armatimonadetes bacterium]|nr:Gfo/Idh/MocA family oxidoreductase [Armatimonadota bacterium]
MDTIGIGIISFAHGHANGYCDTIRKMDDARLVAAWDDNEERGRAAAERFGMEFDTSLDALLSRPDIHAVIVTNETNRHADAVEAAAAAGKQILCQKPMATTLEDCDRIIAAVENAGVKFQMAFQMRCDPLNQQIKQWVENGDIGRVGAIRRRHCINFLFNPDLPSGPYAWHIDPVANVGMFFDDAVHAADFLYWIMGRPESVTAEIDNVLTNVAPDDTGVAIYRFKGGAFGVLFNASVTLAGENTTEVYGDQGVIIQNWDDGVSTPFAPKGANPLKLYRKGNPAEWEEFPMEAPGSHGHRIAAVPRPFIEMLKNGGEPTMTARDGKVSVEMCLAAYQSAREGRRITLSPGD